MEAVRVGIVLVTTIKSVNKQQSFLPRVTPGVCFRFACRNLFFGEGE